MAATAALFSGGGALAHDGRHPGRLVAVGAPHAVGRSAPAKPAERRWLAGDHHVHSEFSVSYKEGPDKDAPPTPVIAGDARNPIPVNARMAVKHGLAWMVSTDHGGPNHSALNRAQAYPELLKARREAPGLILFFGMELNAPGADHASLIIPHTPAEREVLFDIERRFDKREPWPENSARDAEPLMLDALKHMRTLPAPPVVIANHPSRSATAMGVYGLDTPAELRGWNDTAPTVAVGMEGAPGHQASTLKKDGSRDPNGFRGGYSKAPTLGGFDQMTALLGGFWDSMLGEGRRWWVTSTSDSHRHYTDGGNDFWPGEYSKTYVKAAKTHADILDGLRNGRVFVTTGDLVSSVDVTARLVGRAAPLAEIGGKLSVPKGADVQVVIRVRDPAGANYADHTPEVARVDLIRGEVAGPAADPGVDRNPTTRVEARFTPGSWARDGEVLSMAYVLRNVTADGYVRVRGASNGAELEPAIDTAGEDPWSDLWFYANPIFLDVD
ncbi:phosphoesterase [Phenylobacterium sp.]|uniref:phosphoesterase n=1 Tax=Phenylobacterium sp. TaxID=1871053 RepID=UPI0035B25B40